MSEIRFEELFPEPLRCWIVYAPRLWPGPGGWWLDLAREELVEERRARAVADPAWATAGLDAVTDVSYLPPVGAADNWWRQELRAALAAAGADPIVQYFPGEDLDAGAGRPIIDLTPALLPPRAVALDAVPAGVHCCWPLIPGMTTDPGLVDEGLDRLAAAGVSGVHPLVPDLSAVARRRLGESASRQGYQELFHGGPPQVTDFSRRASEMGLGAPLERPACGRTGRALANREIGSRLHWIAELIHRTRGSVEESLSFYRAGRWADGEALDIADLVRSGNLALVGELTSETAREVEIVVRREPSSRLLRLESDFFGSEAEEAPAP